MPVDKVFCKSIKEAVQNGDIHELQRLVRQGKKINENDSKFNFSPLHWAVHYGSLECMHWLLWHGAYVNKQTQNEGWTPAHIASIRGRDKCIQALISNEANLNIQDKRGKNCAHLAASHGNTNTLQEVLRKGVDLEARDNASWTLAHTAAFHGRLACLQVANKWGCEFGSLDDNGNTVAHLAASEGHLSCLKFIISKTGNLNFIVNGTNDQGETPKDLAIQFFKDDCIRYLTQVETSQLICSANQLTDFYMMGTLVDKGLNVFVKIYHNLEHYISKFDAAHPERPEDFANPAHTAAYKGDLEYLKSLIETGVASVSERDEKGSTPAHKAAGNGQVEVLKWLIENGADLTAVNEAQEIPKDVAIRFGQLACIKLLGGESDDEYTNEGEDVINENPTLNVDSKDRAKIKLEELYRQLEIAKLNYQQLGGVLKEDKIKMKEQQEHSRMVHSLEQQLEYERVKREKLESQLDHLRVQVHNLKIQLADAREQLKLASEIAAKEKLLQQQQQKVKKKQKKKKVRPGIFLVHTSPDQNKPARPSTGVSRAVNVKPTPPARPRTAVSRITENSSELNESRSSLRSLSSRSSISNRSIGVESLARGKQQANAHSSSSSQSSYTSDSN